MVLREDTYHFQTFYVIVPKQKINELEIEIQRYKRQYERDRAQLRKLDTDPKAIEKIARERYFMKTENEDIFVLSDDMEASEQLDDETTE